MCGISGIYRFDRDCGETERKLAQAMNDSLTHRGPDEEGLHMAGPVALGHRRLSIIDVSAGQQPMCNDACAEQVRSNGTVWVVFNGEIYNYRTLRADLIQSGHHFRTRSDTEVIVHLYEELGEHLFDRLNGMFAMGIWDGRKKKLILARDRLGKKPLYYHINGKRLAFASELKALVNLPDISLRVEPDSLDHYLSFLYVPSPKTIFSGVSKLEPATYLVCHAGKIRKERYWQPDFGRRYAGSREQATRDLYDLMSDAVKIRLESEVPLGAFLSGGIDSSTVVALMARVMDRPVKTTSIGFEEAGFNELAYARPVAEHCRTDHREHILRARFIEHLPRIIYHLDEPFADSSALPTYLLCQAARQHVTVALSGDGGDESFAGYERYASALREEQWRAALPQACLRLGLSAGRLFLSPLWRGYALMENLNQELPGAAARTFFCFSEELKKTLYTPEFRRQLIGPDATRCFLDAMPKNGRWPTLSRLQAADLASYLPEDILVKVDRMSMAHSLEVRAPLLDYRVVELAASLPPEWKLNHQGSKLLLKDAISSLLPAEIFRRRKMGFSIPLDDWFRHEWRPVAERLLLGERFLERGYFEPAGVQRLWNMHLRHRPWRLPLGQHLWSLVVLELWHRLYVDGESVEEATEELKGLRTEC